MGRGYLKNKNKLKMQYNGYLRQELERVTAENKAMKEDPTSIIGQFLQQFNDVVSQNQRLSALTCALLSQKGGKVVVTRDEIEVFRGKRLRINIENENGPDGTPIKFEEALEYTFTFTATDEAEFQKQQEEAAAPSEVGPCTDPDCTLPKDLKHTHQTPTVSGETVPVPTSPNSDEPQSGLVAIPTEQVEITQDQVENSSTTEAVEAS